MPELILFWHRRDLRLTDNWGISQAFQRSPKIVGLFCFDPNLLEQDDVAPVRIAYLLGCLQSLQASYQALGSQLLLLQADPVQAIPAIATTLGATGVAWNRDVEPYARSRDAQVAAALQARGITASQTWDHLMHPPDAITTATGTPYTVYTPFWKNWSSHPKATPSDRPACLQGLTAAEQDLADQSGCFTQLPTAQALGFPWAGELLIEPGEGAAQRMLNAFCDRALTSYAEQRNFPGIAGTSQLSAALKLGAIGIRTLWQAASEVATQVRSEEALISIRTWQQELAWREFYHHALYHFPELTQGPYNRIFADFPWQNNEDHFEAWCAGRTGYPIVDAAMRQLNETGWMHNRCRMIVASFLTKDLLIDWQWGEKYFMQHLIDGDLAPNNGGWQWSASCGMDPKPLRIFNPASQASKFDPEADYIRQWLPELRSVDTAALVTGKIEPGECDRWGYVTPIVDHHQQQQRFKDLYQRQKNRQG
ncbi:deoxyribodipyrimidine photo-lyase [Trichothermofontia sichuanensis B231]|uniref:FAD-binding domain-containing protein n=1 Tax=Trichothermofontia sichuanensis TaxID=3045816 RepID=UPI002246AD5D|nr:FAD-binding domain-containing protein [Trichothermofontia sichuanensis]UZQ55667.1 deoxyribodipyrimidine photo-lyase [Trichothermofontia sichuanensis B231]